MIDMHLSLEMGEPWRSQTKWAGSVAAILGAEHVKTHPRSDVTLLAHSAGTDAEQIAQALVPRKPGERPVFTSTIAVSPRTLNGFNKDTLFVVEDGDFHYSPQGNIPWRALTNTMGDMGIIPGSMGARSYIVRGKGNPESFMSCSHGAGRAMSRTEAKRRFTVDDHAKATVGVECRKDADVIDETPMAYKSIDVVMEAQRDLVDVVHTLRQVVCVKG